MSKEMSLGQTVQRYLKSTLLLRKYRVGHVASDYVVDGLRVNRLSGLKTLIEENLNQNSVVCEVGSYEGVSSELFGLMCKTVYCVDVFVEAPYERVFDNMKKNYDNIIKIKNTSVGASKLFKNHFFDFVYLDADHGYDSVKSDILHWKAKVKKGGYIGGHDYHSMDRDVVRAVKEFFGKPDRIYEDSSWIVRK